MDSNGFVINDEVVFNNDINNDVPLLSREIQSA